MRNWGHLNLFTASLLLGISYRQLEVVSGFISQTKQATVRHTTPTLYSTVLDSSASTSVENVEPSVELLRGWTEEYFNAVAAAGGITKVEGFADFYSDDYVQTGPDIGPVNKEDYVKALTYYDEQGLNIGEAIPDLTADFDGWHLDPHCKWRIWVTARYRGTHRSPAQIPGSDARLEPKDPPVAFFNGPEMYSFLWTPSKQIQWMSVGYVGDKYTGDNQGYGALVGLLIPMGVPRVAIDVLKPFLEAQVWLSQFSDGIKQPRSRSPYSELPQWWKDRKTKGWNIQQ